MAEHMVHLREVFSRLHNAGLTLKASKVHFATTHLSFLGHIVSPNGVAIDRIRTRAISSFPPPTSHKAIARFMGMVNFFHRFIPNLAHIAALLNQLRKNGVKFCWGSDQQGAFDTTKAAVVNPSVLCHG